MEAKTFTVYKKNLFDLLPNKVSVLCLMWNFNRTKRVYSFDEVLIELKNLTNMFWCVWGWDMDGATQYYDSALSRNQLETSQSRILYTVLISVH